MCNSAEGEATFFRGHCPAQCSFVAEGFVAEGWGDGEGLYAAARGDLRSVGDGHDRVSVDKGSAVQRVGEESVNGPLEGKATKQAEEKERQAREEIGFGEEGVGGKELLGRKGHLAEEGRGEELGWGSRGGRG